MSNEPTPRTDEITKIVNTIRIDGNHRISFVTRHAEQLERELAELQEHVALCHDALRECRGSDASELHTYFSDYKNKLLQLTAVTEQRDKWKAKYIQQNKDLGCEMMDPNGTIWDHAKKVQLELSAMTEQRDEARECLERCARAHCELGARLRSRIVYFENQRDALADALSFVLSCGYDGPLQEYARDKAQEALAAVKGENQ